MANIINDLRTGLQPKGTNPAVVHISFTGATYYNHDFITACVDELENKTRLVAAGLHEFSPLETLAAQLLNDSSKL